MGGVGESCAGSPRARARASSLQTAVRMGGARSWRHLVSVARPAARSQLTRGRLENVASEGADQPRPTRQTASDPKTGEWLSKRPTSMTFEQLPNELVAKIFDWLADEPKSFISLASTCRRLSDISGAVIGRPLAFNLYLADLSSYSPGLCTRHGTCAEQHWRTGARCELQAGAHKDTARATGSNQAQDRGAGLEPARGSPSPDRQLQCFYHRLFAMLNAQHRSFTSLRFRSSQLSDRGCVRSFQDSLRLNRELAEQRISALVALELFHCDITLDWLNTILNQLTHVTHLSLEDVAFTDPSILVESKFLASKTLARLRISGDRTFRITDSTFLYFLDNFPAQELDLTGTRIEFHKRIIQRFYSNASSLDIYSSRPSEYLLTFPMLLLYLKKYHTVLRRLVADETNITVGALKRLTQDEDLKQLRVSVRDCPMIDPIARANFVAQLEPTDSARVTF